MFALFCLSIFFCVLWATLPEIKLMMMIRILDSGSTVWNFEIFGLRRMYALGRLAEKCPVSRKIKKKKIVDSVWNYMDTV